MNYTLKFKLMDNLSNATMASMLETTNTSEEMYKMYKSFPEECKKNKELLKYE